MDIRIATGNDQDDIHNIYYSAFAHDEREMVSKLAVDLLSEETTPQTISLVAEIEGSIVGHVAFSPVEICNSDYLQGYILAPLGVKPDYQKQRIGSKLIQKGIQKLSHTGVNILFVYGDPDYYSRFGFSVETAVRYSPPYRLEFPFGWQGIVLNEYKIEQPANKITCVTSLSDPALW